MIDLDPTNDPRNEVAAAIPVGVSARHVHLTRAGCDVLFGPGHALTVRHPITQPGQFVAQEVVEVVGPHASIPHVSIVGPFRVENQVELARTDAIHIGVDAPVRESGKLHGTPGVTLRGPRGELVLDHGVIVALRHIHTNPAEAERLSIRSGERVRVRVHGARPVIFEDVVVRVDPRFALDLHLDTDEGNAAGVTGEMMATLEPR